MYDVHKITFQLNLIRMVNCYVPDSTNYSAKTKGKNISYHHIPKGKGALRAAWIERIRGHSGHVGVPNKRNNQNSFVKTSNKKRLWKGNSVSPSKQKHYANNQIHFMFLPKHSCHAMLFSHFRLRPRLSKSFWYSITVLCRVTFSFKTIWIIFEF